tara:strand:- start:539 stop:1753 length:1215 start_codon:yes stop_codon:yes gene_type:complete
MISAPSIVLVLATLAFAAFLFRPKMLQSQTWQATVTPLASIIGSGFLVAGPLLAGLAGNFAVAAMMALCAVGYLFGAAIRHNIVHVEPELETGASRGVRIIERASELALAIAYFVSVAYYLHLFAAFGLRLIDVTDMVWIRIVTTVVIAGVGAIGVTGGLDGLENLAVGAVALKLALIAGLFAALAVAAGLALSHGSFTWSAPLPDFQPGDVGVLLGLVILVQGFETSRFLGAAYDRPTRVRTMRHAQWIATAIYAIFFLLITSHFTGAPPAGDGETAIIDILRPVGLLVAPAIILTALASQLSAAVADMNGAGGLLSESSGKRLSVRLGNLATASAAVTIIWVSDIYQIITWASKMFVIFYALQSAQAAWSAWRGRRRDKAALFTVGVVIAVAVIIFAVPAAA